MLSLPFICLVLSADFGNLVGNLVPLGTGRLLVGSVLTSCWFFLLEFDEHLNLDSKSNFYEIHSKSVLNLKSAPITPFGAPLVTDLIDVPHYW